MARARDDDGSEGSSGMVMMARDVWWWWRGWCVVVVPNQNCVIDTTELRMLNMYNNKST